MAGGQVVLAVDNDPVALQIYAANFPDMPTHCGDVSRLGVDDICRLAGVQPGELDLLDASPPCQGFSYLGRRDFFDPRNQLFLEVVRLVRGLRPRAFVMENVRGMVSGDMCLIFVDCLEALTAAGYRVKARVVNTMYYDVPQSRERLILIGTRKDLRVSPSHPRPRSMPQSIRSALGLQGEGGVRAIQYKSPWRSLDLPSPTINKNAPLLRLNGSERPLTFEECAEIQTFPEDWKWPKKVQQYLGNAVPPAFAKILAEHVRDEILIMRKEKR